MKFFENMNSEDKTMVVLIIGLTITLSVLFICMALAAKM